MTSEISDKIRKYGGDIQLLFLDIYSCIPDTGMTVSERLWAGLPSFYVGKNFVRIIPFDSHVNVEVSNALLVSEYEEALADYKITPKGMIQIRSGQMVPQKALRDLFSRTLKGDAYNGR